MFSFGGYQTFLFVFYFKVMVLLLFIAHQSQAPPPPPQFSGQDIIEHIELKAFPSTTPVFIDAAPVG